MLAIRSLLSGCRDIGNIAACARFRDGYATTLFACQEVWEEFLVEGSIAELDDGRNACKPLIDHYKSKGKTGETCNAPKACPAVIEPPGPPRPDLAISSMYIPVWR